MEFHVGLKFSDLQARYDRVHNSSGLEAPGFPAEDKENPPHILSTLTDN